MPALELECQTSVIDAQAVQDGRVQIVGQVENRIAGRAEFHPLVPGRQEAAAPHTVGQWLIAERGAGRDHHHKRGEVLGFAAQAVRDPGADTGAADKLGVPQRAGKEILA